MTEIILIGPAGTGKSTLASLLAKRLSMPQVSLDQVRWAYYAEVGYDEDYARQLRETRGFPALVRYWEQFGAHAVERVLADHHDCVIAFGSGHSVYEDEADFRRVQQALAPYPNVVLILPSPDPDESIRILEERQQVSAPPADLGIIGGLLTFQVKHHCNRDLAKIVIYTNDKTPEETCDELIRQLSL